MTGENQRPTKRRRQRKANKSRFSGPNDLAHKVDATDSTGFALEECGTVDNLLAQQSQLSGVYGSSNNNSDSNKAIPRSSRTFAPSSRRSTMSSHSMASRTSNSSRYRNSVSSRQLKTKASTRTRCASKTQAKVSRPMTHIVCAVGENLAQETCVTSIDAGSPISLQVTKQGNGQTYAETLAYLQMLQPHEVLFNEGRKNSPLARKIVQMYDEQQNPRPSQLTALNGKEQDNFEEQTIVKFIPRSSFDQTKGAEVLRKVARTDTFDPMLVEEYILLSSVHAVLHYTQQTLGITVARRCLDVIVNSGGKNRMAIDRATLLQLELLINAKTGKTQNSLVASIDCTKTTVGARLLRTTLMAPPSRVDTINARLDLVDAFLQDEDFFYAVLEHLMNLPAIDKMLSNVATIPKAQSQDTLNENPGIAASMASKGISALVYIKSTLSALPDLAGILQDQLVDLAAQNNTGKDDATNFTGRSSLLIGLGGGAASVGLPHQQYLLQAIMQALSNPQLQEIYAMVVNVFTESTSFCRNANAMRHQECFALKSGDNGMMEVLRNAFLANVDDIYKKADEYAEMHGMHISVRYTSSRGYYLSIPIEYASSLPNVFIQPVKSGKYVFCTSEEVHSLNTRAQDNVQDLLLMTFERIQEVLSEARAKYDSLAALSDAIALLDLCHGFADKVTLSKQTWCRPIVVDTENLSASNQDDDGLLIRKGRYGIEVSNYSTSNSSGVPDEIIPNDTYVSRTKTFSVISGINGAGKSTYLKQIAIIVLLAHCGGYVPAEHASIPLRNRLCVRIGTADDQENNISSFMLEMKETAFICSNANEKSLVLLDELGRATSNEDGVSIAWAVAECLLKKRAMCFFVTHYPQLCQLSNVYSKVQNQHLAASIAPEGTGDIRYTYKLANGPCTATDDYGIDMALSCGWPIDVAMEAREIKKTVSNGLSNGKFCSDVSPDANITAERHSWLHKISGELVGMVQNESSVDRLCSSLQQLRLVVGRNQQHPSSDVEELLASIASSPN